MSLARKCDRCGFFYEVGAISQGFSIDFHVGLSMEEYDLCPECADQFRKWINTEDKEDDL